MLGERALDDVSEGILRIPYPNRWELPEEVEARNYRKNVLQPLYNQKNSLQGRVRDTRGEYDSSLLEKLTGEEERLYGSEGEVRERFTESQGSLSMVNAKIADAEKELKVLEEASKKASKKVQAAYRKKNRWRQLKVFVWEAVFWVPFFALSLFWYTGRKRKESKWEVISLSVLIAASFLSLQSIGVLLWSWIPRAFLEWLWELLAATLFTRIVGYYVMIAVSVLLFGSLIVFIHRRITDPVRGGKKKIRHELCPTCSYPLNLSEKFCGGCGTQLLKECPSCQKSGYTWQAVCVHCGTNSST